MEQPSGRKAYTQAKCCGDLNESVTVGQWPGVWKWGEEHRVAETMLDRPSNTVGQVPVLLMGKLPIVCGTWIFERNQQNKIMLPMSQWVAPLCA